MSKPAHVLIIGAGLGGPSLALALAKHQIRSTIFERRPTPQNLGGVLMLAPNAIRVLDKIIRIEPEVRKVGRSFEKIDIVLDYGEETGRIGGINVVAETFEGYKGINIPRPAFHDKLIELCKMDDLIDIQFAKNLCRVEEGKDSVKAVFEDGTEAEGDILLGLDGIHSRVRQHVLGTGESAKAKYTGSVVLGSIINKSEYPALSKFKEPTFIYTQAGSILVFPTDPSAEQYQWAAFIDAPERDRKSWETYRSSGEAVKDLRKEWQGITSEPIPSLMSSFDTSEPLLWAPYEIPDISTWHTDRVCLLGDACHAISPSAGQGTAQALEDVGFMTRLLTSEAALAKGYPALFEHFEIVRRKRLDLIRKFTERSLATRFKTSNWAVWWGKSLAYRATFWLLEKVGPVRKNEVLHYDVEKEDIEVQ